MNPDLLEQLRALLGPSRTASTPLPPVMVTAPANQPTMGPRGTEPSYAPPPEPEPMSPERLAAELAVSFTPAAPAPDVARALGSLSRGDVLGTAGNSLLAAAATVPGGMLIGKGARGLVRAIRGTHEAVPGTMAGHLPGLLTGSEDLRRAYSQSGPRWRGEQGTDVLYDAMGMPTQRTLPGTGAYTPPGGVFETNPLEVARATGGVERADELNAVERVRALLDAQNAGAYHTVTGDVAGSGVRIPLRGAARPAEVQSANQVATQWGGGASDTGTGLTMFGPFDESTPSTPILQQIQQALRGGMVDPSRMRGAPYQIDTGPSGYVGIFENATSGGGAVTREALGQVDPALLARLDQSGAAKQAVEELRRRDAMWAQGGGVGAQNPAVEYARQMAAQPGGFQRLRQAAMSGDLSLPALGLVTGGTMMGTADEGDEGQGLGGATLAMAGLLTGRPRRSFEAFHGSPMRGMNRFDNDFVDPMGMAGAGHYVAGADRFGAGRAQAEGYVRDGEFLNVRGQPVAINDLYSVPTLLKDASEVEALRDRQPMLVSMLTGQDALPLSEAGGAFQDELSAMRRRMGGGGYDSLFKRRNFTKDILDSPDLQQELAESVIDRLERRAAQMNNLRQPQVSDAATRAAQLVYEGDVNLNRGALYRVGVDADRAKMINYDRTVADQPKAVRELLESEGLYDILGDTSGRTFNPNYYHGDNILDSLAQIFGNDTRAARDYLMDRGIQGVKASGGSYTVPTGRRAMSTQYTIFDPERIRILDMLAPALAAGGLGAYVADQERRAPDA
jgi:hypothetical protein